MKFSLLMNMKIIGIFIFISRDIFLLSHVYQKRIATDSNLRFIGRTNFMLSLVEYEKKFYNIGASFRIPLHWDATTDHGHRCAL